MSEREIKDLTTIEKRNGSASSEEAVVEARKALSRPVKGSRVFLSEPEPVSGVRSISETEDPPYNF